MISVIIPAYNEENYIESTLKSLKSQTFKDFETIVVCNGCTDNTSNIAKKYTSKVYQIEKGIAKARNLGAEKSNGEILVFLDADTLLFPNTLEKISKTNNFGTCKGKPIENNLSFKILYLTKNIFAKPFKLINGLLFCRKDNFQKVNGYDNIHPLEHKYLIKKLKNHSTYKLVNSYAKTSMRRYKKEGLFLPIIKLMLNNFKKNKHHEEIR